MRRLFCVIAGILLACSGLSSPAATVTYQFSGTIGSVDTSVAGFPSSLAGVSVGDAFSGTLGYDTATPSATYPYGGVYASATYYPLSNFTFSLNVGGTTLNTWTGTPAGFVWNDQAMFGTCCYDGLTYTNPTTAGDAQFVLGNILLSTATFSSNALPDTSMAGPFQLNIRPAGSANNWISSSLNGGLQVAAVPLPAAGWVLGSALLSLVGLARRRT